MISLAWREAPLLKFPVIPASKLSLDLEAGNKTNSANVFGSLLNGAYPAVLLGYAHI